MRISGGWPFSQSCLTWGPPSSLRNTCSYNSFKYLQQNTIRNLANFQEKREKVLILNEFMDRQQGQYAEMASALNHAFGGIPGGCRFSFNWLVFPHFHTPKNRTPIVPSLNWNFKICGIIDCYYYFINIIIFYYLLLLLLLLFVFLPFFLSRTNEDPCIS